ncbi:MAG: DASS family sodium-coupled anion symporter [Phycisphaerales bacterium]
MAGKQDVAGVVSWVGLGLGPVLAVVAYVLLPGATLDDGGAVVSGLTQAGRATAAIGVLMAVWWLTEAIPLSATSLVPLVAFPLCGCLSIRASAAPYASDVIFLFLGGFILGLGMERWGLHKRIALLTVRLVGTGPRRLIGGFMLASAVMSMWVSNTATTIMMLPIALSVITLVAMRHAPEGTPSDQLRSPDPNFDSTLLLGIAYASSIGGVATLIGTAPNAIMRQVAADMVGKEIGFAQWMMLGVPLVAVMLPLAWVYMVFVSQPVRLKEIPGGKALIKGELKALGPVRRGEWVVLCVFVCTVLLWVFKPVLNGIGQEHGWLVLMGLNDSSIAIMAALALFLIPVKAGERTFAMDWRTAERLPWGTLLLFGGGLSLAAAISANGVDAYIGGMFQGLEGMPIWLMVLIITTVVIFLTELTSNTAVTTTLLPILVAAAAAMEGVDAMRLIVPAAVAASMAFMLPVATPPNAIVFGSGRVTIREMGKAGIGLNLIGIVVITVLSMVAGDSILAVVGGGVGGGETGGP